MVVVVVVVVVVPQRPLAVRVRAQWLVGAAVEVEVVAAAGRQHPLLVHQRAQ